MWFIRLAILGAVGTLGYHLHQPAVVEHVMWRYVPHEHAVEFRTRDGVLVNMNDSMRELCEGLRHGNH